MKAANDILGWFIVAVVVVSPIPLGSNPPIFWAISGCLIGLVTFAYFGYAAIGHGSLRVPLHRLALPGLLWGLLLGWLLVQMLPLGDWFGPIAFVSKAGDVIAARYLSLAPGSTWLMAIRMCSYGLVFFLASQAGANEGRAKRLLTAIFWAIVLHAAFGLFQLTQLNDTLLGFDKKYYVGVATGTFVNRNSYATYLAMGLALGAALLARLVLSKRERNLLPSEVAVSVLSIAGGMLIIMISLMASQSRMGFLAAVIGVTLVGLLTLRWMRGSRWMLALGVLLVAALGLAMLLGYGQGLLERLVYEGGGSSGRDEIYAQVWTMIATRPWLGFGGGAFELAFPMFYGAPLSPDVLIDKAHSTYLSLISELGVIGGLLPVLIVGLILGRLVMQYFRTSSGAAVLLAGIGVVAVGAAHSVVDFSLEMQANAYLMIAILGLAQGQASGSSRRADYPAQE